MNILIIGEGGRESAILQKIYNSKNTTNIFIAPGNGGTERYATKINIKSDNITQLASFALENKIDLTIVGPEIPLSLGIVDYFQSKGLKIFGPSKNASRIEGSKSFAKNLMKEFNIPTAKYQIFNDVNLAMKYIETLDTFPVVVKADGLAAGKGVYIVNNLDEANNSIKDLMDTQVFGESGKTIVIEEYINGKEFSVFAFTDGDEIKALLSACDYKKAYDDDEGPNTGGMGSYSPAPEFTETNKKYIVSKIIKPTLKALEQKESKFVGVLYCGLILTTKGIYVIEFNCRLGDPETQVVIPTLNCDLIELIESCLGKTNFKFVKPKIENKAVGVVLSSNGYPNKYAIDKKISINNTYSKNNSYIFHAGTKKYNGNLVTSGGRVLTVVGTGNSINQARNLAYKLCDNVNFENKFYRKDIAKNIKD